VIFRRALNDELERDILLKRAGGQTGQQIGKAAIHLAADGCAGHSYGEHTLAQLHPMRPRKADAKERGADMGARSSAEAAPGVMCRQRNIIVCLLCRTLHKLLPSSLHRYQFHILRGDHPYPHAISITCLQNVPSQVT
jgi:hypothetical protein